MTDLSSDRRRSLLTRHVSARFSAAPLETSDLEAAALAICARATDKADATELLRECWLLTYEGRKTPLTGFRVVPGTAPADTTRWPHAYARRGQAK